MKLNLFSLFIISSSIATFYFVYVFPSERHTIASLLLDNVVSAASVFPRAFPLFLQLLPESFLEKGLVIVKAWVALVGMCGIGMLLRFKCMRIFFMGMCIVHLASFALYTAITLAEPLYYPAAFGPCMRRFAGATYFLIFILPGAYLFYLTRVKVKELFR